MSIENKIRMLFSAGLLCFIIGCGNGSIPLEVRNEIEKKLNIGMDRHGYGYLVYASGRVYDRKGHGYSWYTTGSGGKRIDDKRFLYTLIIRNDKETKYSLEVDMRKNRIIKMNKK